MPSISTVALPPRVSDASPTASASARRKRSSPTNTLHSYNSTSALVYPVPDSIAWLEQLSPCVRVSDPKARLRDAKFELHVDHAKAKVAWVHARSFDEYRQFQQRLQKALRHGHFCHAECPWLFTFVKSYFPKTYLVGAVLAPKKVLHTRREALERFVKALQTFLVNRCNHSCSVLTSAVADEVLAFVNGDAGRAHQCRLAPRASSECAGLAELVLSTSSLPRRSWDSNVASSDGDSDRAAADEGDDSDPTPSSALAAYDDDETCRICNCHLGDEANSPTNGIVTPATCASSTAPAESPAHAQMSPVPGAIAKPATLPPRAPPLDPRPRGSSKAPRHHFYTTKLACGHRFHDECIVPKLNEAMNCPVCGQAEGQR